VSQPLLNKKPTITSKVSTTYNIKRIKIKKKVTDHENVTSNSTQWCEIT